MLLQGDCLTKDMVHLLITILLVTNVAAEDGKTEIALNVFSDIAPILALFGEQFATQFASQSLTWLDHVLIAMVPLGIITIISGAIRVAGPQWSKAVIGRARESRALAEAELMSSVSNEVCEMFNGRSIIRAIGKNKMIHFLIFPPSSKSSGAKEDHPQTDNVIALTGDNDKVPYIHTIETAHSEGLIGCEPYHSESYKLIKNFFTLPVRLVSKHPLPKRLLQRHRQPDVEARESQLEYPNAHQRQPERTVDYPDLLNIQLNVSKRESERRFKKGFELFIAGLFAITIQCGLICVAAITVFHQGVKTAIGVEAETYGFPCYVAGSVLLSVGIALCSLAIEQATEEREWTIRDKQTNLEAYPQLVFLQQDQRVQDMKFHSYVISAGRRYSIITSNRREELQDDARKGLETRVTWKTLTLLGALVAGLGFTAQFIGLRGLAYPCAIAHLLAIILMAVTRAFIRRRLGDRPPNIPAIPGHELDFLAHNIVFNPNFEDYEPDLVARWGVKTPGPHYDGQHYVMSRKEIQEQIEQDSESQNRADLVKDASAASEMLLVVRKRLGNLSHWKTKASPSALSVAKSVEAFMNTFFPPKSTKSQKEVKIDWLLETWKLENNHKTKQGFINIPIKSSKGTWAVDLGKVAAVLSLWIASIEENNRLRNESAQKDKIAKDIPKQGSPDQEDWRRSMAELGSSYKFCRILGNDRDEQLLKRDLYWWVDELQLDQSNEHDKHETRNDAADIFIGFNGRLKDQRQNAVRPTTLRVTGSEHLPIILAQHLFTSFMWTVAEKLPSDCLREAEQDVDIVKPDNYDIRDIRETWHLLTLRHRKLANLVRRLEGYGLGHAQDILLCMIPALSFKDLLPNDRILSLIPQMSPGRSWVETARCYNNLLKVDVGTEERFTFSVVAMTMDFINLAFGPYVTYDSHVENRDVDDYDDMSYKLRKELFDIVRTLASERFGETVQRLVPLYELQNRRLDFFAIFKRLESSIGEHDSQRFESIIQSFQKEVKIKSDFFELHGRILDFTRGHKVICSDIAVRRGMMQEGDQHPLNLDLDIVQNNDGGYALKGDIFGWTTLHYSCLAETTFFFEVKRVMRRASTIKPIHEYLDKLGQSPIHVAIRRNRKGQILHDVLEDLDRENVRIAIETPGMDGMAALHLAVAVENAEYVKEFMEQASNLAIGSLDIWGREALHIAAKLGNTDIALKLMKSGASLNRMDNFGKSAIVYLFQQRRKLIPHATLAEFIQASQRDTHRDKDGKSLFHIAAEVASPEMVCELQKGKDQWDEEMASQDANGRTPLALAILASRPKVSQELLRCTQPRLTLVEDHSKMIPLMHAAAQGLKEIVEELSKLEKEAAKKRDDKGRTALHCALDNSQDEAAAFLLNDSDYEETKRMDESSILITACKRGCVLSVNKILFRWPRLINEADERYGETPLAWACEYGRVEVVRALLECERVDPNIAAKGWIDYTPLHFAVRSGKAEIVECLAKHPNTNLSLCDKFGYTPLNIAVKKDDSGIIQLLCIKQPNTKETIESLTKISDSTFAKVLPELLTKSEDSAISDDDISGWVERSVEILYGSHNSAPLAACLERASERDTWKKLELPCHRAAQIGEFSIVKRLLTKGANLTELDADNWSWVDYGRRYSAKDIDLYEDLSQSIHQLGGLLSRAPPKGPSAFTLNNEELEGVKFTSCNIPEHKHQTLSTFTELQVMGEHPSMKYMRIATQNPIVPTTDRFYFEMTIIKDSFDKSVGLGFCNNNRIDNRMPGWDEGSWGYHGDDGCLFVEHGHGEQPSADFGDSGQFHAGDVVGCGLDMKTGEGFCTLNGKRLNMGNAFETSKFRKGKIYPCVGVDVTEYGVGLRIQVNFGSDTHPFQYRETGSNV